MGRVPVTLKIGKRQRHVEAHVLRDMDHEILLGLDSLELFGLSVDLTTRVVTQNGKPLQPVISSTCKNQVQSTQEILEPKLASVIQKHSRIFSKDSMDIGNVATEHHRIRLTNNVPIRRSFYRCSHADNEEIETQLQDLLKNNLIRPSTSPYAFPVVLARKKDDTKKRLCIDYRPLNNVTVPDPEPIPRIDDILDELQGARYFTTLDITSGYWHVSMHSDDIEKTAFVTKNGHYEWTVMPFGLKNAPSTFQRIIKGIISKYKLKNCAGNYFDDIIIRSGTYEQHLHDIDRVLSAFGKEGVKLKMKKCRFAKESITFLGHTITKNLVTPNDDNIKAVLNMPPPKNVKQIQRFLGTVNVYNKFIENHAQLRKPLTDLLKKDAVFCWTEDCQAAFDLLKQALTAKPVLKIFDPTKPCILYTDASSIGIGAVLKQTQDDGLEMPIAYHSRKLNIHEANYAITELECLAIVDAVTKWHNYLSGGKKFKIITDHSALQWLKTIKNPSGRLFRWSLRLSMYEFDVVYQKGEQNFEADNLSRDAFINLIDVQKLKDAQELCEVPRGSQFVKFNGIISRKRRGLFKAYVPENLRLDLLHRAHKEFGHVGINKTLRLITMQYYWPSVTKDVTEYIKHCDTCQRCKKSRKKKFGHLESLPPSNEPFDLLAMDTIGGLAGYGSTKNYIHLTIDHATRYIWAFPHKSQTSDAYITCLKSVFQTGTPRKFLSDRGSGFLGSKFRRFLKNHNVHQLFTSSQHPQCNGMNERTNQTIVNRLRCKISERPTVPWPKLLNEVVQEYNNTPHEVTGYAPVYLLFGTPPYTELFKSHESLIESRKKAVQNSLCYHEKNKIIYDQRFLPMEFKPGDLVMMERIWQPNQGKLVPAMEGPFKILKKISSVNYEIDKPNQPQKRNTDIVHISKLRRYFSPDRFHLGGGEDVTSNENSQEDDSIECIKRVMAGTFENEPAS